jgi:mRNA interferase RelE/StbE
VRPFVGAIAGPLAENPHRVGKPLIGDLTGLRSERRGTYRVIYAIHEDTVVVEVAYVQPRSDAHRSR